MESRLTTNIPNPERVRDRIDELREYLEVFTTGPISDAARRELERLEQTAQEYGI